MDSSFARPTQGTRIIDALDMVEQEMSMLVDPDAPPLSQRSEDHRRGIFRNAETRLNGILALVPRIEAERSQSLQPVLSNALDHSQTQVNNSAPGRGSTEPSDMPWNARWTAIKESAASKGAIGAEEFNRYMFNRLLQRKSTQNLEDEALERLLRSYADDDASWVSALEDMRSPYRSNLLELYSQLNTMENRDLIYRQLQTAQHQDKIHNFVFYVVSFMKLAELLLALARCESDARHGRAREDYAEDIFSRRYKHLLDRLNYHSTPAEEQERLKKQLSGLKRTLKKRFKERLERADLLAQMYHAFGAAVLLDPFWHFDWLEDLPSFSKGFKDIIVHACDRARLTEQRHADCARGLQHVMAILGDEDARTIVEEWLNSNVPKALAP